jgi:hypothetical protein
VQLEFLGLLVLPPELLRPLEPLWGLLGPLPHPLAQLVLLMVLVRGL